MKIDKISKWIKVDFIISNTGGYNMNIHFSYVLLVELTFQCKISLVVMRWQFLYPVYVFVMIMVNLYVVSVEILQNT